jgi:hypothetical protein
VTVASVDEAREAVATGQLDRFTGTRECGWLDAKKEPYKLGNPASDIELLKDVAALANAVGGILLIGFDTLQRHGREVVGELHPVPVGSVNPERYRKLLRERVFPLVRGLRVEWVAVDDDSGVLAIDVPEQSESSKPFVVPGRNDTEGFSLPIRDDDGTLWLSCESVQRVLSVGWNAQGGVDREAILDLIRHVQNSSTPAPEPAFHLGQDAPGACKAFEEAWAAAGGMALGLPSGPTERIGPGLVQHLASGAIICAIDGHPAVVVSEGVWEAIARIGARANIQGAAALGLPDLTAMANSTSTEGRATMIDERHPAIVLAGGSWGPGRLLRSDPDTTWTWEPVPRIDFLMVLSNLWSASDPVDLRVRAVASLPFVSHQEAGPPKIDRSGRSRLEAALRHGQLNNLVNVLCLRRGGSVATPQWQWPTGEDSYQSDRAGQYRTILALEQGEVALTAEVMIQLADGLRTPSMTTCVDVRVNFGPWRDVLDTSVGDARDQAKDLRLTVEDLVEFFLVAWPTATLAAPRAALPSEVLETALAGAPRVEFRIDVNPSGRKERYRTEDVLDLSAFGAPTRQISTQGGFGVTAPLDLPRDVRRRLLVQGLTDMAQAWGFIDADAAEL